MSTDPNFYQKRLYPLQDAILARALLKTSQENWALIRWQEAPPMDKFVADLHILGETLILGN